MYKHYRRNTTNSVPPRTQPAHSGGRLDPRTVFLISICASSLIWYTSLGVLCFYAMAMYFVWYWKNDPVLNTEHALRNVAVLCLLWVAIYIGGSIINLFLTTPDSKQSIQAQALSIASNASTLGLRMLLGLSLTFWLSSHYSTYTLARAICWCVQPIARHHAWKFALALALMLSFLQYIRHALVHMRTARILRHMPYTPVAYWRYALPQLVRLTYARAYSQAMAVAARKLHHPSPWQFTTPLPTQEVILCMCCISIGITLSIV